MFKTFLLYLHKSGRNPVKKNAYETVYLTHGRVRVFGNATDFEYDSLIFCRRFFHQTHLKVSSFLEVARRIVWNSAIGPSPGLDRV